MSESTAIIRTEQDGSISFGDYTLPEKTKVSDYEFNGDLYKVKTFTEITKLEKNGLFIYESVPGTSVSGFRADEKDITFRVSGKEDVQITLELEEEKEYEVLLDDVNVGKMKTNVSGKLNISIELGNGEPVRVRIIRL